MFSGPMMAQLILSQEVYWLSLFVKLSHDPTYNLDS
jgi:hypothetical protein